MLIKAVKTARSDEFRREKFYSLLDVFLSLVKGDGPSLFFSGFPLNLASCKSSMC